MDSADGGQRVPATPQAGGGPGRVTWLPAALRRGLFRQLVRRPGASNQLLDAVLGLDVDRVSRQLAVQLAAGRRADWGEEYVWQEPGETGHPSTSYQDLVTLFDHLALPAGSRFVDLGCGFGRAGFVAALLCQDVCFVGYELVAERVAAAQRAAARLGLRQLVFETADLSRVQPVDADVYYVFCSFREDTGRRVLGLLQAVAQRRPIQLVVNTAMYGFEPEATPWLRLVAQVGIFSHYASVAVHAAADWPATGAWHRWRRACRAGLPCEFTAFHRGRRQHRVDPAADAGCRPGPHQGQHGIHGLPTRPRSKPMRSIIAALLCCAMLPCLAAPTCVAVGGFASAMPCCAGLVRDANQRCQLPTCKQDGVRAVVQANGVSDCCIGMVVIGGVCRVPTLHRSVCAILGDQPTGNRTCCSGLARNAATGRCAPSGLSCNAEQIGTCCHGVGKTVNTCNCYCPNQYYN